MKVVPIMFKKQDRYGGEFLKCSQFKGIFLDNKSGRVIFNGKSRESTEDFLIVVK